MSREHVKLSQTLSLFNIIVLSLTLCFASTNIIPAAKALTSYTGAAKPMEFYFHHSNTPVRVAGLETKYTMNTTRLFGFVTQQEAYINSFYKPIGLPKIEVDFYLYPNLAGPVTIDGLWQVFVWINGSAYKPAGFTLQFKEVTVGGETLWDSGQISPTVTSSVGTYIDVPIYNYNLSTPLTHTFSADSTLLVAVEVNAGSSAATRIWYDSLLYPSKAILPAKDYARPLDVKTYAYDGSETDLYHYNWSQNQRIVTVHANITDPFGGYDIHNVNMTILDPANNLAVDNVSMIRSSDGQWQLSFSHNYNANYSYPPTAQRGNYTVKVSVIDNNGYYRYLDTGSFAPFIEYNTHVFSIGIIVYYNPAFLVVDDVENPLPNAQVYITWPNGSRDVLPRYTSSSGFINLTQIPSANYGFIILWKDVVVKQVTMDVESNGPYTIKTEVYQLRINVVGSDKVAVHGAYVIIYTQTGVGYGLAVTDETGQAVLKLPKGIYNVETHYSAEYWLKFVTTKADETGVSINASTSKTIVLTEFPPPLWTTTGFWLLLVLIAVPISVVILMILLRRRHSSVRRTHK